MVDRQGRQKDRQQLPMEQVAPVSSLRPVEDPQPRWHAAAFNGATADCATAKWGSVFTC